MKKKIITIVAIVALVAVLAACLTACNKKSDWEYIEDKGTLVIGYTLINPLNYEDKDGNLIGFETEFATAVCEELGVKPVFQPIVWDSKIIELNAKNIDCIWNGMTITEELKENMDISIPYMENRQVAVTRKSDLEKFNSLEKMKTNGAVLGAERKSAGEKVISETKELADNEYVPLEAQANVLLELKAGTINVGFIDLVMASASVGENTDYSDLVIIDSVTVGESENYGVGLRKNSPETLSKINAAIKKLYADGFIDKLAEKYNLSNAILPQE